MRSTLSDLILQTRGMTDAGLTEWTNGTQSYWDDDQMQAVLDRHRVDIYRELLESRPTRGAGGTLSWREYVSQYKNFEATDGGTAVFVVEDSTGLDAGTANYSTDYARGVITFGASQGGTAYYMTGRSYDLNAAAADIWRIKAANVAKVFDVSTDNHSLSRSQLQKQCLVMAEYYEGRTGFQVMIVNRGDVADDWF